MTGAREPMWSVFDSRDGQRVTITAYPSEESAERQIERWRARDATGRRPDLHESMPYLEARPTDWGQALPPTDGIEAGDATSTECAACGSMRILGVEITEAYDGVLFWECDSCGYRWHRWPKYTRQWARARSYVERGLLQPGD